MKFAYEVYPDSVLLLLFLELHLNFATGYKLLLQPQHSYSTGWCTGTLCAGEEARLHCNIGT